MSQVHSFEQSLERSKKDGVFWEKFYKTAFPGMTKPTEFVEDLDDQRNGIDRRIFLPYGTVTVEEKFRPHREGNEGRTPSDIALEYLSSRQTNAHGWIEKDLRCDWFAYAWEDAEGGYLLKWPELRQAWVANRERWLKEYKSYDVVNKTYDTVILIVPILELRKHIPYFQWVNMASSEAF